MNGRFVFKFVFIFLFLFVQTNAQFINNQRKRIYSDDETGELERKQLKKESEFSEILKKQNYIKNLRLEVVREGSRVDVKLTWLPFESLEKIVVVRNKQPITTEQQFYSSRTLAILPAETASYIDRNVLSGNYYYAVASQPVLKNAKLKLHPNENYTLTPLVIENFPVQVQNIKAEINKIKEITVSWQSVKEKVFYVVYRGRSSFKSADMLTEENIVAVLLHNQDHFVDKDSLEEGDYYYAVTTRNEKGEEDKNLTPNQSYTTKPVTYRQKTEPIVISTPPKVKEAIVVPASPKEQPKPKETKPTNIFMARSKNNQIELSWNLQEAEWGSDFDKKGKVAVYRFYRKPQVFEDLAMGNLVATPFYYEGEIFDKPLQSGNYYYAIFFQSPQGLKPQSFVFEYNLIGPIVYADGLHQSTEEIFAIDNKSKIPITEESEMPQLPKAKEPPLQEVTKKKSSPPPKQQPQEKQAIEKVTKIIEDSYFKNSYQEALLALQPYLVHQNLSVQALAKYYSGLSLYRLGNFSQAANLFKDELVQKAYKDKALFWYKRAKEHKQ